MQLAYMTRHVNDVKQLLEVPKISLYKDLLYNSEVEHLWGFHELEVRFGNLGFVYDGCGQRREERDGYEGLRQGSRGIRAVNPREGWCGASLDLLSLT